MSRRPPAIRGFLGDELVADEMLRSRFELLVHRADGNGCWEWQGCRQKRPDGSLSYGVFSLGRRRASILAHRAAYIFAHGRNPGGAVIRHRCDNVACVRPDHLLAGTQADNLADMRARGRAYYNRFEPGTAHPNAKLNPAKVRKIRARRAEGKSLAAIGTEFGLHPTTVHDIVRRFTWRHVA